MPTCLFSGGPHISTLSKCHRDQLSRGPYHRLEITLQPRRPLPCVSEGCAQAVVHVSDGSVHDCARHWFLLGRRWVLLGATGSPSAMRAANKPSLPTPLPAPSPPHHEHGAKNMPCCKAPASLAKQTNYQPQTSHDKRFNVYPSSNISSKTKATVHTSRT